MKNFLLIVMIWGSFGLPVWGQEALTTVNLDLIQNRINGGKPLPSEEKFYVHGAIPSTIEMVRVKVYPSKKSDKAARVYYWTSPFGYDDLAFKVLIEDPLRSNDNYHVEVGFYQRAGKEESQELRRLIETNLSTYLNTITSVKKGGIHMEDSDDQILSNMSQIVETGAYYFEMPNAAPFPGFSDLTRKKLEQRKKLKMGRQSITSPG